MLDAIKEIESYEIKGIASFSNSMLKFATAKQLEIIGEAANNLSEEIKNENDHIPWKQIIGMRNNLTHEYFRVDLGTIWSTVSQDLPVLKDDIKQLLKTLETNE